MVLVTPVAAEREKLLPVASLPSPLCSTAETQDSARGLSEGLWGTKGAAACFSKSGRWGRAAHGGKSVSNDVAWWVKFWKECKGGPEILGYWAKREA